MFVTASLAGEGKIRLEAASTLHGLAVIVHLLGFGGILMIGPLVGALARLNHVETAIAWLAGGAGLFWSARSGLNALSERDGERMVRLLQAAARIIGTTEDHRLGSDP